MTEWTGQMVRQLFAAAVQARADSAALIDEVERVHASVAHDRRELDASRRAAMITPEDTPADAG